MQTPIKTSKASTLSIRAMHKYVMAGIGIWMTFVATFVIAYHRVGQSDHFAGQPFQALAPNETQKPASSY